jgi:hypothetical protein
VPQNTHQRANAISNGRGAKLLIRALLPYVVIPSELVFATRRGSLKRIFIAVLAIGMLYASPLLAHHGDAGYDTSKLVLVKGIVTDFQFINPHVEISLDVKNDGGAVENWQGEMNSPNILSRASGWNKNTLKPGDQIVLEGHRAKNGLKVIRVEKVSLADGTELFPKGGNGVTRF